MHFTIFQIIMLTVLAFIKHVDYYGIPMIFVNYAVFWGLFTGVLMGDIKTGLIVGGTVQLMSLGVAGFGGSSVPDYGTCAIIATAFGSQLGVEAGLAIGLPVGMLGVQLDVIVKILNGFVVRKSQEYANKREFKKMNSVLWLGPIFFGLSAAIPVFIAVTLGQSAVNYVLDVLPSWFMDGLTLAGKIACCWYCDVVTLYAYRSIHQLFTCWIFLSRFFEGTYYWSGDHRIRFSI